MRRRQSLFAAKVAAWVLLLVAVIQASRHNEVQLQTSANAAEVASTRAQPCCYYFYTLAGCPAELEVSSYQFINYILVGWTVRDNTTPAENRTQMCLSKYILRW